MTIPMKLLLTAMVAAAAVLPCHAQQRTATLEECYTAAERNYPMVRQYELIEKSKDYTLSNASKAYLPQVTLSAKASWQSDVTKFSLDKEKLAQSQFGSMIDPDELAGMIPTMSKDQYGASIDISQTIWDGGAVKASKDAATSQAEADAKSVDASIYGLRAKVNEMFFGIILMQSNIEQCELMLANLETNYKKVGSYIENGMAGQAVKVYADQGASGRKEYDGTLIWISDKAEFTPKTIQTRNERANLVYAVKIAVKNDGLIKLGMYGEVKF